MIDSRHVLLLPQTENICVPQVLAFQEQICRKPLLEVPLIIIQNITLENSYTWMPVLTLSWQQADSNSNMKKFKQDLHLHFFYLVHFRDFRTDK